MMKRTCDICSDQPGAIVFAIDISDRCITKPEIDICVLCCQRLGIDPSRRSTDDAIEIKALAIVAARMQLGMLKIGDPEPMAALA